MHGIQSPANREEGRPIPARSGIGLRAIVVVWLVLSAAGMAWLTKYEYAPGTAARPEQSWPAQSRIGRTETGSTIVMFAHPRCPCTRASIGELDGVMARCPPTVRAIVVFVQPPGFDREWVESDLWDQAAAIPGVVVMLDRAGVEAQAFGVRTSGQVLVYNVSGKLQFHGGITPSRGHAGDNVGRSAVLAHLGRGGGTATRDCSVFGCPLFSEAELDDSK